MLKTIKQIDSKFTHKTSWGLFAILMILFIAIKLLIAKNNFSYLLIVDESLYLNAARSLHYEGKLLFHGQPSTLSYMLYPAILSVAYFFYSPETIMMTMRTLGILIYALGFIPIYLLSGKILKSPLKALAVTAITMLIPETNMTFFISQEITHFPLMMTAFFLFYMSIKNDRIISKKFAFYHITLGIVFFLLFENKAIGIVPILSYIAYIFAVEMIIRRKQTRTSITVRKLLYVLTPFIILSISVAFIKSLIYTHSGLPVTEDVPSAGVGLFSTIQYVRNNFTSLIGEYFQGTVFYIFYFLIAIIILPVLVPIMGFKGLDSSEKRLIIFSAILTLLTIISTVATVYVQEGGSSVYPQRFHLRYLYYSYIPFIILSTVLVQKRLDVNSGAIAIVLFLCLYTLLQFGTLSIITASPYDYMSLLVTDTRSMIIGMIVVSTLLVVYLLIKKKSMLSVKAFIATGLFIITCFIMNMVAHINVNNTSDLHIEDFTDVAKIFAREDNVLLVGSNLSFASYDGRMYKLDGYLVSNIKYIESEELMTYMTLDYSVAEPVGRINLSDIVPANTDYGNCVFQLGDIDYLVVGKLNIFTNAYRMPISETSTLFDVYKIEDSVIDVVYRASGVDK